MRRRENDGTLKSKQLFHRYSRDETMNRHQHSPPVMPSPQEEDGISNTHTTGPTSNFLEDSALEDRLPDRKRRRVTIESSCSLPIQGGGEEEPSTQREVKSVASQSFAGATVTPSKTKATAAAASGSKRKNEITRWLRSMPIDLLDPISDSYVRFWYSNGQPNLENLIDAMRRNDETSVIMLLRRNASLVRGCDEHDWTPLHFACLYGLSDEIINFLLALGACITKTNSLGQTALHRAVRCNNVRIAKLLLEHAEWTRRLKRRGGVEESKSSSNESDIIEDKLLNFEDIKGLKLLHYAAMFGGEEMVKLLIEKYGAKLEEGYDRKTPLHAAIEQNNKETVPVLLNYGADLYRGNGLNDKNALHYAVERGDQEMVELILNVVGKEKDHDHYHSNGKVGRKRKRDNREEYPFVDRPDWQGRAPLIWAVHRGHEGIVRALLKHGANINYKTRQSEQTALHMVSRIGRATGGGGFCCCESMVQLLVENGAEVNAQDAYGETALHYLAKRQSKETVIRSLVENHGANVMLQNNCGRTAADIAETHWGSSNPLSKLLRHHADKADVEEPSTEK